MISTSRKKCVHDDLLDKGVKKVYRLARKRALLKGSIDFP
jgi:hypothetical protein